MNLNNKYLAIGLSVAAVVIVSYQLFFNKTKETMQTKQQSPTPAVVQTIPATTPAPQPSATLPNTTAPISDTANNTTDEGPPIDYHSEILLKRIKPELVRPFLPREITPEFGSQIFVKPVPKDEVPVSTETVKEIEFVLNGILIDSTRRLAIINDTILKIGDMILGAQITAIVKNKVILKFNQQEIVLSTDSKIKKFTISGGTGDH